MSRTTLFVCAHQDDEVAFATRMLHERRSGAHVSVIFLTDPSFGAPAASRLERRQPAGAVWQTAHQPASGRRSEESRRALAYLGVGDVTFVSGIADGSLVEHLDDAFTAADRQTDVVYALAYEGGHHDHDAAHLVAAAIAAKHGVPCIEMPLYRAAGVGPLFRVLSPGGSGWTRRRVPLLDALRALRMIFFYRSQWRTWMALLPEGIFHLPFEHTREADQTPPPRRYYERRFRFPYERFIRTASPFVERHLAGSLRR